MKTVLGPLHFSKQFMYNPTANNPQLLRCEEFCSSKNAKTKFFLTRHNEILYSFNPSEINLKWNSISDETVSFNLFWTFELFQKISIF